MGISRILWSNRWSRSSSKSSSKSNWIRRQDFKKVANPVAPKAAAGTEAEVKAQPSEQDELDKYFAEQVTNARFWTGRICVDEDINNPDQFQGSYDQVTSKDGRRLARVSEYKDGKTTFKYYEVKATVIHSKYGQEYKIIIPDTTKQVTDAQF